MSIITLVSSNVGMINLQMTLWKDEKTINKNWWTPEDGDHRIIDFADERYNILF